MYFLKVTTNTHTPPSDALKHKSLRCHLPEAVDDSFIYLFYELSTPPDQEVVKSGQNLHAGVSQPCIDPLDSFLHDDKSQGRLLRRACLVPGTERRPMWLDDK